jgi:flagella basal body P-ring formation protein FlgA
MRKSFKYIAVFLSLTFANIVFAAPVSPVIVKEQKIRAVMGEYLLKMKENPDIQIRVRHIGYSGDITIPDGETEFEVVAPRQWEGWGKATLALIIRVNDRVEKNISIPVEVEALTNMVVTVRPLERGEIVDASDVSLQKRDLATAPGKISRNLADVVGKKVRIGIRGNAPVRSDYLEKQPLVKSGQNVTIIAENDMLKITAVGRVKNPGAEGDLVTVQNLGSLKDVQARVVDAGTVRVEFQ